MHKSFKIGEAFKYSWGRFKANWQLLVGSFAGAYFVNFALQTLLKSTRHEPSASFIFGLASVVIAVMIAYMVTHIGLLEGKGVKATLRDVFAKDLMMYIKVFAVTLILVLGAGILCGATVGMGIIFSVSIPHDVSFAIAFIVGLVLVLYFSVVTKFSVYALIDGSGIFASIKKSFEIIEGSFWKIVGLLIVTALFNILGIIALVVGLAVTVPVSTIMFGYAYHKLVEHYNHTHSHIHNHAGNHTDNHAEKTE